MLMTRRWRAAGWTLLTFILASAAVVAVAGVPVLPLRPGSTPAAGAVATRPATIDVQLEVAKAVHARDVAAARAAYITTIDARLNAAEDAGNLAQVELILAAKHLATDDGALPAELKDPAIVGAHATMRRAIEAADARLASAYHEAIARQTKARKIAQAEAIQKEFVDSGLAANVPESVTQPGQIVDLSADLPSYLAISEPYTKVAGGIRTEAFVKTRAADFGQKDFTFDLWFTPERADDAEPVLIGIGGGNPEAVDHGCLTLEIKPPSDRGSEVTINTGQWEGRKIGVLREEGTCVARIRKQGNQIVFEVGVEAGGKFVPDVSGAVADVREIEKGFNDRNTYLYFGHRHIRGPDEGRVTFNKVRLSIGSPAPKPSPTAPAGGGATVELKAGLPAYLSTDQPYGTRNGGIQIERPVETTAADFLDKDFTFDVWFTRERADDAEGVLIGIGGSGNPDSDDGTCVSLVIDPPEDRPSAVSVNTTRWRGNRAGTVTGLGPFHGRVEKRGDQMTFAVGSDDTDGRFTPDVSSVVANIRQLKPNFNDRNTHLYFGHRLTRVHGDGRVTFTKVRLSAAPPSGKAEPPAPAQSDASEATHLTGGLPDGFTSEAPYTLAKDGIRLAQPVRTKATDFIDQDFTFEVGFTREKGAGVDVVMVGIGDGNLDALGDNAWVALMIDPPNERRGSTVAISPGRRKGDKIGVIRGSGPFLIRMQKKGNHVDYAIGTEADGRFTADASGVIEDLRRIKPGFNARNTPLFFAHRSPRTEDGRVTFQRVSLTIEPKPQAR